MHTRRVTGIARMAISATLATSLMFLPACSTTTPVGQMDGVTAADTSRSSSSAEYATLLFDDSRVHEIDIEMDDGDWDDLLEHPSDKTKYEASVTIDGETIDKVSFATKGNSSLTSVASDEDSDRYGFKVNFGKYVDGQTYHGLDKLNLSNMYSDATYMKDYISYEIFRQAGVDAPLTSYAWLRVNGEDVGLYLAIEEVGDSYLDRAQEGQGELYKPESYDMGNKDKMPGGKDGQRPQMPEGMDNPMMMFGGKSSGGDLTYVDDDPESYSVIFENDETDADEESNRRVIAALKALSEGKPDEALDTDAVISYFVAHNFVLNYDSYTGTMTHNYYLYEKEGKLSMLPWDYNLAFGGFGKGGGGGMPGDKGFFGKTKTDADDTATNDKTDEQDDDEATDKTDDKKTSAGKADADEKEAKTVKASAKKGTDNKVADESTDADEATEEQADDKMPAMPQMANPEDMPESSETAEDVSEFVNMGIDTPLSIPNGSESSRPMWAWIQNDGQYAEQYHEKYDELLSNYFESAEFEKQIDSVYEMIRPYVEKDPTAFYTPDEFDTGYETLKKFCLLRAESIRRQLDGKLSTKTDEQDEKDKVTVEGITVSDMGRPSRGKDEVAADEATTGAN